MVFEKAQQRLKEDGNISERAQKRNEPWFRNLHFDLCQLQDEERERHLKKRMNGFKEPNDDEKKVCRNEIYKIVNEPDQPSKENNQLLTNADRSWIITHSQTRRRGRKNLQDYLRKNHEIFTLQYTLNVKRNEIERLDNQLRAEERALAKAEKYIVEDLALFDQFLDSWSRSASDAAFRADEESRKKEELVNEIKRLQKTLVIYHNDQNHLTDVLRQSRRYQQFLFKFAPEEWRTDILKHLESTHTDNKPNDNIEPPKMSSTSIEQSDMVSDTDSHISTDENYSLYFTKPEQLLDIFTEMEEKSFPLVQKSQYTSETLDKIHSTINTTLTEQNAEVNQLQMQINQFETLIKEEIEREISCQTILIQYKTEKDDPFIEQIRQSIEVLYKKHIISDDSGISTIHMLQTIENKIKSLFNTIEHMDSSIVKEAEKFREIAVRTMDRQEKARQEKLINQSKRQKAFLRASAPPYPKIGRIIMERSAPLFEKKHRIKHSIINNQEQLMRLLEN